MPTRRADHIVGCLSYLILFRRQCLNVYLRREPLKVQKYKKKRALRTLTFPLSVHPPKNIHDARQVIFSGAAYQLGTAWKQPVERISIEGFIFPIITIMFNRCWNNHWLFYLVFLLLLYFIWIGCISYKLKHVK